MNELGPNDPDRCRRCKGMECTCPPVPLRVPTSVRCLRHDLVHPRGNECSLCVLEQAVAKMYGAE